MDVQFREVLRRNVKQETRRDEMKRSEAIGKMWWQMKNICGTHKTGSIYPVSGPVCISPVYIYVCVADKISKNCRRLFNQPPGPALDSDSDSVTSHQATASTSTSTKATTRAAVLSLRTQLKRIERQKGCRKPNTLTNYF